MALAPAVSQDNFSFVADSFYVRASGGQQHRRATVPDLKALFDGDDKATDRPGHWYEAQLLHYGLPPSKTKGTAKMRLYDAVRGGGISVPAQIRRVEADLKKKWTKSDKETKKTATPSAKGTKRKASDTGITGGMTGGLNLNLAITIGSSGFATVQSAEPAPASKKAKTTTSSPASKKPTATASTKKSGSATGRPAAKENKKPAASAAKGKGNAGATSSARGPGSTSASRGGRGGTVRSSPAKGPAAAASPATPRKQTARRGGFSGGTRATPWQLDGSSYDEPPPPYPGSPMDLDEEDVGHRPLAPLGLLNGRYEVDCYDENWEHMVVNEDDDNADYGMILTLDGSALWGSFEFRGMHGVLRLAERPWQSSQEAYDFAWRGDVPGENARERKGLPGQLTFLGGGEVEGTIDWHGALRFRARRISGQQTRSDISPASMRRDWREYEYE